MDPLPLVASYDACLDLISVSDAKAQKKKRSRKFSLAKAQKTVAKAVEVKPVVISIQRRESSIGSNYLRETE